MSLGRKKKKTKKVVVKSQPTIQTVDYLSPTGDRFTTTVDNGVQSFGSSLGAPTQSIVNESLQGMLDLAKDLREPDGARQEAITQRSRDFYDLQARGINRTADERLFQTQSDLSKRFGGTYNATFGGDLLARMERDRQDRLSDAQKESSLLGEDLYRNDEDSRIRRFSLFQNYLNDLNNQARGLQTSAANTLDSNRQQADTLAIQRATLMNQLQLQDQAIAAQERSQRRLLALQAASNIAGSIAGIF